MTAHWSEEYQRMIDDTGIGAAAAWMKNQEPVALYVGYDGEIYPQYRLRRLDSLK